MANAVQPTGGEPSGTAGGGLSGTYPDPSVIQTTGLGEFSVYAHGGDPTGTNDSSAAISAAQAAARAAGGGYVVFGTGTWKSGTVTIAGVSSGDDYTVPPLVHFRFAGPGATVLTPLNEDQAMFQVQSGHHSAGVRLEGGFTVKAHASGSTGPAIDLTNARQWIIESLSYLDSSEGGSPTPGTYAQVIGFGVNTYACRIVNPICEGQVLGGSFAGTENVATVIANANSIVNPLFEGNTSPYMVDAAGTLSLSITDGIMESNTVTAEIRLGKYTRVSHSYFEQGAAAGVTYAMDAAGVDNPDEGYDPGGCILEYNQYFTNPDTLTIPAGVTPGTIVTGPTGNLVITDETASLITNFEEAIAWLPPDAGFTAWNFDCLVISNQAAPTLGSIYLMKVKIPAPVSVTSVNLVITAAGALLTTGENLAGLYTISGGTATLLASTDDQTTNWETTGFKTMALDGGPYILQPGFVYVAILANGTTAPKLGFVADFSSIAANAGLSAAGYRAAVNGTGATALSSPLTLSASSATGAVFWTGLS